MIGRLRRTIDSSQCGTAKEYPGNFGAVERVFDIFGPFENNGEETICATIIWESSDCNGFAHPAAYSSFDPQDRAAGYLGDLGPSNATEFGIDLVAGESFSVVVMQVFTSTTGIGCNYRFLVGEFQESRSIHYAFLFLTFAFVASIGRLGELRDRPYGSTKRCSKTYAQRKSFLATIYRKPYGYPIDN